MSLPIKYAVSYVIYKNKENSECEREFVSVQRPTNDADLPNAWGLPAGMHCPDERSWEDSVLLSGRQKLGVDLTIEKVLSTDDKERKDYILRMKQFEVSVPDHNMIKTPQDVPNVTQYQRWKWATTTDLEEASSKGSLCSLMYLSHVREVKQ